MAKKESKNFNNIKNTVMGNANDNVKAFDPRAELHKKQSLKIGNKHLYQVNLKINNEVRNELKTLVDFGYATSQADALRYLIDSFHEKMDKKELGEFMRAVHDYNRADERRHKNRRK